MTPAGFAACVAELAGEQGFPPERIVLGGDHLGPNPWQHKPAAVALAKAQQMVRDFVATGFTKIHLDASMHCADDDRSQPLDPQVVAERAADLCAAAEDASRQGEARFRPVYVIGTEVPTPGGAQADDAGLQVTAPAAALETIELFRQAFLARGLDEAWTRTIALVVQPGVEFGDEEIHEYDRSQAAALSRAIETQPGLVYEAHSTDYQTPAALRQLVEDHFAILKVGPALTFAFREAIFALAQIEEEWLGRRGGVTLSRLPTVIDQVMIADPRYWLKYYPGAAAAQAFARRYSLSDRIRYYWPHPDVQAAQARLVRNLRANPPPLPLLSQFLPEEYRLVRERVLGNEPLELIWAHIDVVLRDYSQACG
jgi:D-tagatose-1,6-bisphosphate aldolase subunit GatZ/KbaZ